jgi:hypothetical protein
MRRGMIILFTTILLAAGCAERKQEEKPFQKGDPSNPAAHVNRGKEIQANKNDLVQIVTYYNQHVTEFDRPPANLQELKSYMGGDGGLFAQAIEKGTYVVQFGVKPSSNVVLVYEAKPDLNGNQLVAMGDRATRTIKAAELQKALQVKE